MCPLRIELEGYRPFTVKGVNIVQIPQTGLGLFWHEEKGKFDLYTQRPGPTNIAASSTLPRNGDRFEIEVSVIIPHPDAGELPTVLSRTLTLRRVEKQLRA